MNYWFEVTLLHRVLVHLVVECLERQHLVHVLVALIRSGGQADDDEVLRLCLRLLVEVGKGAEHPLVRLVDDHHLGLLRLASADVGLVLDSLGVLPPGAVAKYFQLLVALCVIPQEALVLKDNVDLMVGVLEEEVGEGSVDPALALPRREPGP